MEQTGRGLGVGSSFGVTWLEFGVRAKAEVQVYEPRCIVGLWLVPLGVLLQGGGSYTLLLLWPGLAQAEERG